jgi:myosin heavy subunit
MTVSVASHLRFALAKHLYALVFAWIVQSINLTLAHPDYARADPMDMPPHTRRDTVKSLGILDIYGFEILESNSFEQLCINFANERLQHFFVTHMQRLERIEFSREGLCSTDILPLSTDACVRLLDGPAGVFQTLDDECFLPSTSDAHFLQQLFSAAMEAPASAVSPLSSTPDAHKQSQAKRATASPTATYSPRQAKAQQQGSFSTASRPVLRSQLSPAPSPATVGHNSLSVQASALLRFPRTRPLDHFTIAHFAGSVTYQVDGFVTKNRDALPMHHLALMLKSTSPFVHALCSLAEPLMDDISSPQTGKFPPSPTMRSASSPLLKVHATTSAHRQSFSSSPVEQARSALRRRATVSIRFRSSLDELISKLEDTNPHFVRCINPNIDHQPFLPDRPLMLRQLRACGIIDTLRMSAMGFPGRWRYDDFLQRYACLLPWMHRAALHLP